MIIKGIITGLLKKLVSKIPTFTTEGIARQMMNKTKDDTVL